ncbi:MAG: hypothetical protein ACTHN0_04650 [Aquihabitans sp.]
MDIHLHRAYDLQDHRRHAIGLNARTCCGLSRTHVRATSLAFDPDDFFACPACAAAMAVPAA